MNDHEQVISLETLVEMSGISKRYGQLYALHDIDLSIAKGSVHALVGENGAGKSTLGKIVAGMVAPSAGVIRVDGRSIAYRNPRDALADGITMISQEVTLVPERSVVENVFLGIEKHRFGPLLARDLERRYKNLTERAGFGLPPHVRVSSLNLANRQKVEILRSIARHARLVVMDEPTAALSANDTKALFGIIRKLNAEGTTIVYVSHALEEVLEISDTVTVLKDGRLVRTGPARDETVSALITGMLGRPLERMFPEKVSPVGAPIVIEAAHLSRGAAVRDVSLHVRAGEILGIAGLVGSGRSEMARLIFGAEHRDAGTVSLDGRSIAVRSPRDAVRNGIGMLPESRKEQGLLLDRSSTENISLAHLGRVTRCGVLVARRREHELTGVVLQQVGVRGAEPAAPVRRLSGGNQQKVLLGRWLFNPPRVLIADEPTRGVDVGAKLAIYELLVTLAASGMAVIVICSEFEEVLGLAHRIMVMRAGAIVGEFGSEATKHDLLEVALGQAAPKAEAME